MFDIETGKRNRIYDPKKKKRSETDEMAKYIHICAAFFFRSTFVDCILPFFCVRYRIETMDMVAHGKIVQVLTPFILLLLLLCYYSLNF